VWRAKIRESGAWRYSWATYSLKGTHTDTFSSRMWLDKRLITLFNEEIIVAKSEEVKTGRSNSHERTNLAE
jgi:hypothetical protein